MRKKTKIEQDLDQKEFENELNRDLKSQYSQLNVRQKQIEGKNVYVIAAMHFFSTLIFFEALYWVLKWNVNYFTLGTTIEFFSQLNPFVHAAILILSAHSIYVNRSAVDVFIDKWPF